MVDYRLRIEQDLAALPAEPVAGSVRSSPDTSPSRARRRAGLFIVLAGLGIFVFLLSLSWSSVAIPIDEIVRILLGGEPERAAFRTIVMDIRRRRSAIRWPTRSHSVCCRVRASVRRSPLSSCRCF
jgi:ABC-type enterobactin transport system permease subunit